jgi:hypothetical protein
MKFSFPPFLFVLWQYRSLNAPIIKDSAIVPRQRRANLNDDEAPALPTYLPSTLLFFSLSLSLFLPVVLLPTNHNIVEEGGQGCQMSAKSYFN